MSQLPWCWLSLALALAGGCTTLDVIDVGPPEYLPWASEVPRWDDGRHQVAITADGDRWQVTTDLPRLASACRESDAPPELCADADFDTLVDAWETMIVDVLRPELRFGSNEHLFVDPDAKLGSLGQVEVEGGVGASSDAAPMLVFIVLAYSRDYGSCSFTEHAGDLERVVLRLRPLPDDGPGSVEVITAYTSAHEGTSVDHSATHDPSALRFIPDVVNGQPRWLLFVSEGKHALYVTPAACRAFADAPCVAEGCPSDELVPTLQLLVPVVEVGQFSRFKLPADTVAEAWPFSTAPGWSADPFCGDADPGTGVSCAPLVSTKLYLSPLPEYEAP